MDNAKARRISIASILFWLWGVLMILIGFAVGYPAYATQGSFAPIVFLGGWGALFCLGGFALPRHGWGVRWWGPLLCMVSSLLLLFTGVRISLLGIAVNLIALGLIVSAWSEFSAHRANNSLEPTR